MSLAKTAQNYDEVPVGAVITHNDTIIATAFNKRETLHCACAHAEVLAIQKACQNLGRWRLYDCTLYVTLEPCVMCAGAAWQARIPNIYYGASDPKGGAMGSLYSIHTDARLNHKIDVTPGIEALASKELLQKFFRARRKHKKDSFFDKKESCKHTS
ncbi:MAG: tRNA adenosine(34) deaminase TadA [Oligoflexales bacterium]